jgi:hypothetical protein
MSTRKGSSDCCERPQELVRGARNAKKRSAERALADTDANSFAIIAPSPEPQKKTSRTWAALLKRVFELEPLVCPRCGGARHIKAFITELKEVARLLDNLGIPVFVTPRKICGPPHVLPESICSALLPTPSSQCLPTFEPCSVVLRSFKSITVAHCANQMQHHETFRS